MEKKMNLNALICVILYTSADRVVFYPSRPDSDLFLIAWTEEEINIFNITLKDQTGKMKTEFVASQHIPYLNT